VKTLALSLTIASALALSGCSTLVSLNPFVTAEQSVVDPALLGAWASQDGKETYWIRQDGNGYTIRYAADSADSYQFKARLMVVDGVKILDLVSAKEDGFQIAVHTPLRVWTEGSTLRMTTLQSDWLKEQAKQNTAIAVTKDRLVMTAPGDVVAKFLARFAIDAKAGDDPDVLRRIE